MNRIFILLTPLLCFSCAYSKNYFYIDAGFGEHNINYYQNGSSTTVRLDAGYWGSIRN
ncbi:MAG: hypothetical protein K2P99_06655 [Burkholderiales bacterium]|nr:hypothetical protein [Burkholderiales bacterium]